MSVFFLRKVLKMFFFFFFKASTSALEVNCFLFLVKSYSILPVSLQHTMQKSLHFCMSLIDHLFDKLESGKRKYRFGEKSRKSIEFWIQESVRTLVTLGVRSYGK